MYNAVQMIGNAARGGLPGGNKRFYVWYHQLWGVEGAAVKLEVRTWYQTPLITFLVADPLRNPRISGRPIATPGFLKISKRKLGRLGNMVKSKSERVEGRAGSFLNL